MAKKTGVLVAPYSPIGSLMHYPEKPFSHYADPETGERLEKNDIWRQLSPVVNGPGFSTAHEQIRRYVVVRQEPDWRPNLPFHATLQLQETVTSGRSAKYLWLAPVAHGDDHRRFPMFVTDLVAIATTIGVQPAGIISGRWMVAKRGQNYGLRLAREGD